MAFKETISGPAIRDIYPMNHIWHVSGSVGWGNHNFNDDVALIQYLINKCAGKRVLETDGIFGQKTFKAIKKFQDSVNKSGVGFCRVDGRVSNKIFNDRAFTTNGENYTIDMLNWLFFCEKRIYFDDLRRDPECPSDLVGVCEEVDYAV